MLPPEIDRLLRQYRNTGWSGVVSLNMKDGAIISFEVTEKHRVETK